MPQQYERPDQTCDQCHFITHIDGFDCYLCNSGTGYYIAYNGIETAQPRSGLLTRNVLATPAHRLSFHQRQALVQAVLHHPEFESRIKDLLRTHNYLMPDLDP